jgi:hypothetical protein
MRRLRLWRLVKLTGWSREEILNTPAVELDWLLAIEDSVKAAEADRSSKGKRPADPRKAVAG